MFDDVDDVEKFRFQYQKSLYNTMAMLQGHIFSGNNKPFSTANGCSFFVHDFKSFIPYPEVIQHDCPENPVMIAYVNVKMMFTISPMIAIYYRTFICSMIMDITT